MRSRRSTVFLVAAGGRRFLLLAILLAIALFYLVPFVWTAASALRPAGSLYEYANPLTVQTFLPARVTLQNFVEIFEKHGFGRALFNSSFVALSVIVLGVVVNTMAGFAFAKFRFPLKPLVFAVVLVTPR